MDRQKLVEENMKLVYEVAHKYKNLCCTTIDFDDLVSIGSIGLIKASKIYDDTKNIKFSTLAFTCIKNSILREFVNKQYNFNSSNTISLNTELSNNVFQKSTELQDIIPDDRMDKYFDNLDNKILIDSIYEKCNDNEKKVIDLYLEGYSLKEISIKLKCHWATVSRMITNLRKKYMGGETYMKLDDKETVCPYCFGRLGDDINGKTHIKYCLDCGKWWETYTEEEE